MVASRFLRNLAEQTTVLGEAGDAGMMMVDIDDTIVQVHGHHKHGAAFGYSGVRGLNALLATVSTDTLAPVIAAIKAGADVSITVRMDPAVKRAIASITEDTWTTIKYTDAIYDEATGTWISKAQVAEVPFTAFTSKKKTEQVPGRLVVRRIPDLNPKKDQGQDTLFQTWRFHAFFTTTAPEHLETVTADQVHRRHAIIENVHADLKASALAHLPSEGVFTANAAWLVCAVMAFNLTRAAATTTGPALVKATTATIRRKLIAVPSRLATTARRLHLHLPARWPWAAEWTELFRHACGPPAIATT